MSRAAARREPLAPPSWSGLAGVAADEEAGVALALCARDRAQLPLVAVLGRGDGGAGTAGAGERELAALLELPAAQLRAHDLGDGAQRLAALAAQARQTLRPAAVAATAVPLPDRLAAAAGGPAAQMAAICWDDLPERPLAALVLDGPPPALATAAAALLAAWAELPCLPLPRRPTAAHAAGDAPWAGAGGPAGAARALAHAALGALELLGPPCTALALTEVVESGAPLAVWSRVPHRPAAAPAYAADGGWLLGELRLGAADGAPAGPLADGGGR